MPWLARVLEDVVIDFVSGDYVELLKVSSTTLDVSLPSSIGLCQLKWGSVSLSFQRRRPTALIVCTATRRSAHSSRSCSTSGR